MNAGATAGAAAATASIANAVKATGAIVRERPESFVLLLNRSDRPLIVVARETRYRRKSLRLSSGDVLVFFTDGMPEARNPRGEFYGEERLRLVVTGIDTTPRRARDIKQAIIDDVTQFSGTAPQHDDMTVVVVKVL